MSCFIKLDTDKYIQWSKTSDSPVSKVMSLKEMTSEINKINQGILLLKKPLLYSTEEIIHLIEKTGTSDPFGIINLDSILEYNRAGSNESKLTLIQLIEQFK